MSKKQRRRTLKQKKGIIITGKYSMEKAKMYFIAALLMFHIIPLFFVFMGENGRMILAQMFMYMLNPIFLFAVGFFYGIRNGFDWKFPLILTVVSTISIVMYYDFENINYVMLGFSVSLCVYAVFSYLSTLLGGFLKRFLI
ncbi:MAG: hypothetical protein LIO59_05470 [Oscillospiraceae bacterium]|nr:hypothetical protein [Oscillospiraceae bacterium]